MDSILAIFRRKNQSNALSNVWLLLFLSKEYLKRFLYTYVYDVSEVILLCFPQLFPCFHLCIYLEHFVKYGLLFYSILSLFGSFVVRIMDSGILPYSTTEQWNETGEQNCVICTVIIVGYLTCNVTLTYY